MQRLEAVLAVPGDLTTRTGGYLYDRRVLDELRALGRDVGHMELPASFPTPTPADRERAAAQLATVPRTCAVIVDGLAFGALDPAALANLEAPVVALVHHPLAEEPGLDPERREELLHSERANLARARHVVVTSPHTAEVLTSRYGVEEQRITVARPGVDRSRSTGTASDPPLILSVGIAVPRKGHDILLRALARITDRPWQATIVGTVRDEPYADELEALAARLNLSSRVRMVGGLPEAELAELFACASIFALATRYEGYGMVFDEAMVHGLPIVSCAVGAVPDTVAPGAGYLVPPEDPGAFADALARVLDDTGVRGTLAAASRRAGAALPGWDRTAQQVAGVIDRVVSGG